jgi:hypothetical protein
MGGRLQEELPPSEEVVFDGESGRLGARVEPQLDHCLFLAELSAFHEVDGVELPAPPRFPLANIRVMVLPTSSDGAAWRPW